jgi:DNA-binding XRE family transcriptional regulator
VDYEMRKIGFEISQKRRGMSQKELAEKANITQQQISNESSRLN